jgi:mono/diheme cytochrome c family protein
MRATLLSLGLLLVAEPAGADGLADDTRRILADHCGQCHDRESPKADPKALKIFDVTEKVWWSRLTDKQLPKLNSRMQSFGAPEDERTRVAAFVTAELARRAH